MRFLSDLYDCAGSPGGPAISCAGYSCLYPPPPPENNLGPNCSKLTRMVIHPTSPGAENCMERPRTGRNRSNDWLLRGKGDLSGGWGGYLAEQWDERVGDTRGVNV